MIPSSASVFRRTLLTVVKAVSAEEKKPDKNNKIIRINNCMTPSVSKIKPLLICQFYRLFLNLQTAYANITISWHSLSSWHI